MNNELIMTKILTAKFTRILSWWLIISSILWQCPYTAERYVPAKSVQVSTKDINRLTRHILGEITAWWVSEAEAASGSDGATPLAPFQSEFFKADLITGSAVLSVPIVAAPGRKGIQPNLALSYSSNGGNTWCGVGWNLDLGSIQRDTRAGRPAYNNDSDTFLACFSGANTKLVNAGGKEYRAKIDAQFMKFTYESTGDYWQVWDKSGVRYRFGYTSNSKITNAQGTFQWCLDEVMDTCGNYMEISYTEDQEQIYPAEITYTGNKGTGESGKQQVEFITEARTDSASSYRSGYNIVTQQRLKDIVIRSNDQLVRKYCLSYEYSADTQRSLLKTVTEYGQDGATSLPAVKSFSYMKRDSNPGGALQPELVLNGGTLSIDGEKHFKSIHLKNGAVLTAGTGISGLKLNVDTFVKLEGNSRIDLDGKGYSGGSGGAGGAGECSTGNTGNPAGLGGKAGSAGEGTGNGGTGSDGGDGKDSSILYGGSAGGGGGGGGEAGGLPGCTTYDQTSVHAGAGGTGASGGGSGGYWFKIVKILGDWRTQPVFEPMLIPETAGTAGETGGGGGGYLRIICQDLTIAAGSSISACGESGGSGGNGGLAGEMSCAGSGGGGHGAGGGAGGGIYLKVSNSFTNNGSISVRGGDGGAGGPGGHGWVDDRKGKDGSQGPAGSGGRIEIYYGSKSGSGTYTYGSGNGSVLGTSGCLYEECTGSLQGESFSVLNTAATKGILFSASAQTQWVILPIMGDFNGDGRVDAGKYHNESGAWYIALGQEDGTFAAYESWASWVGYGDYYIPIAGDFNHDGFTDAGYYNNAADKGTWGIALSKPQLKQLNNEGNWLSGFGAGTSYMPVIGDFNGDTFLDIGVMDQNTARWKVALGNGSGFTDNGVWQNYFGYSDTNFQPISGDFNGDGLGDIGVVHKNGDVSVALSDGKRFIIQGEWQPSGNWYHAFAAGKPVMTGDYNNDGLTDIGSFDKQDGKWTIALSTGSIFAQEQTWLSGFGQGETYSGHTGDFSGDGLTDAAIFNTTSYTWAGIPTDALPSDILTTFTNGVGGKTTLTYEPSTKYDNSGDDELCDLPFPLQTIAQVKAEDGVSSVTQVTNYTYSGGVFDVAEKEFIGFAKVTVRDAEGNTHTTEYNQDKVDGLYLYKGLPEKEEIRDTNGTLYQRKTFAYSYTTPYAGKNYAPQLVEEESAIYNSDGTAKTTGVSYQYDGYGNINRVNNKGDTSTSGDEKEDVIEYVYSEELWILGLPGHKLRKDAAGKTVSQGWYYYDSSAGWQSVPTQGLLTKEEAWLEGGENPCIQRSYDDYGNVLSVTDTMGQTTTSTYETTLHTYPQSVTNVLGHTAQWTYDTKTGAVLTATDANGQTTTNEYDTFGRLSKVFGPNDDSSHPAVWYEYDLSSCPVKITTHIREEHNSDDSGKIRTAYAFYDGLGRCVQNKSEAEDSAKQIVDGTATFTSRGLVKEKYQSYAVDTSTEYTQPDYSGAKVSFTYDCLGRVTQSEALNENGETISSTTEYKAQTKTESDAQGNKTGYTYDADGRIIKVEEHNGSEMDTTEYSYDCRGNLTKTTDNQGNVTGISYDSLGRKTAMNDPDMGNWSYEYDKNGNLIKQTDAKGQALEFQYDALNRLTNKLSNGETIVTYTYDDSAKSYCIGRLSKVTYTGGTSEFFYDNLGREIKSGKTIDGVIYTVQRSYDALDRLKTITYPDGESVGYTYNRQGGIETVTKGSEVVVSNADYSVTGQMKLIVYGNGAETAYSYNSNTLRLARLKTSVKDTILQDLFYNFDNTGNVTGISDTRPDGGNSQTFSYDGLSRLTEASGVYGTKSYTYDSIGNILTKDGCTYTYGAGSAGPHAVTNITGQSSTTEITYDSNGNMLTKGGQNYAYDSENRLIEVSTPVQGSQSKTVEISLTAGWNLISLPLMLSDTSLSSVLSSIAGNYDQVNRYNPGTQKFESYVGNSKFDQFNQCNFGEGLLIHITTTCTLEVSGSTSTEEKTLALSAGWNLIAPAITQAAALSTALNNLQEDVDYNKVMRYNKSTLLFENVSSTDSLQSGEALYIYCLKDSVWNIPVEQEVTSFAYDGDGGRTRKLISSSLIGETTAYVGAIYEVDEETTL